MMNPRYHFCFSVVVVSCLLASYSQPLRAQQLGYGFRAGVNFPGYSLSSGSSRSTVNFQVGAFAEVPLAGDYLSLQPGLTLQGKGAKGDWFFGFSPNDPHDPALTKFQQHTMWLDIPVNLLGKLRTSVAGFAFAGIGPYLGIGLSGKHKIGDTALEDNGTAFAFGKDKSLRGLDFGMNFTLGYQLPLGLQLYGSYGLGLVNLSPSDAYTQKNKVWTIGLGYSLEP